MFTCDGAVICEDDDAVLDIEGDSRCDVILEALGDFSENECIIARSCWFMALSCDDAPAPVKIEAYMFERVRHQSMHTHI